MPDTVTVAVWTMASIPIAFRLLGVLASSAALLALLPTIIASAHAEVVTDGSLGAATSLTGPNFAIAADLGEKRGGNLFHSFSQFNLANGESATFSGPADVANIISRITGGNVSTIDGLLRSDIAGANLFLLNPAGIIFGANASLDISGSLHVSSADYLVMDDMAQFLATPLEGELLSTAAPAAFGFLGGAAGALILEGTELTLKKDSSLSLVGGGITLDNATLELEGTLGQADFGTDRVQLQMVGIHSGEVSINPGTISDEAVFADIDLRNGSQVRFNSSLSSDRGQVWFRGDNIRLQEGSRIATQAGIGDIVTVVVGETILEFPPLPPSIVVEVRDFQAVHRSGDVYLGAEGELSISGSGSGVIADSNYSNGSFYDIPPPVAFDFDAGTITLEADTIILENGAQLDASTEGIGRGGDIHLYAQQQIRLSEDASMLTDANGFRAVGGPALELNGPAGDAGNISVTTGQLSLAGSQLSARAPGGAMPGNLSLNVADRFEMSQGAILSTESYAKGEPGGDITITAGQLQLMGSAEINTSDRLGVRAGNITLDVAQKIELNGSQVAILAASNANIFFPATVNAFEAIVVETEFGIIVVASPVEVFTGFSVIGGGERFSNGGTVAITSAQFDMLGGATISTSTSGQGHAGAVALDIDGPVTLRNDGTAISSASLSGGLFSGDSGSVVINASAFTLSDGAAIRTTTATGGGSPGTIALDVVGDIRLQGENTTISSVSNSATDSGFLIDSISNTSDSFRQQ